jgi:hypothetical protein
VYVGDNEKINCSLTDDALSCKFMLAHAVIVPSDISKRLATCRPLSWTEYCIFATAGS